MNNYSWEEDLGPNFEIINNDNIYKITGINHCSITHTILLENNTLYYKGYEKSIINNNNNKSIKYSTHIQMEYHNIIKKIFNMYLYEKIED